VPEVWDDQLTPALVVVTMVPPVPTAKHTLVVGQETACRSLVVLDGCSVQLAPALVVAVTVPLSPTAKQALAEGHDTPDSTLDVPRLSAPQLEPALVVPVMFAASPTAAHVVVAHASPISCPATFEL